MSPKCLSQPELSKHKPSSCGLGKSFVTLPHAGQLTPLPTPAGATALTDRDSARTGTARGQAAEARSPLDVARSVGRASPLTGGRSHLQDPTGQGVSRRQVPAHACLAAGDGRGPRLLSETSRGPALTHSPGPFKMQPGPHGRQLFPWTPSPGQFSPSLRSPGELATGRSPVSGRLQQPAVTRGRPPAGGSTSLPPSPATSIPSGLGDKWPESAGRPHEGSHGPLRLRFLGPVEATPPPRCWPRHSLTHTPRRPPHSGRGLACGQEPFPKPAGRPSRSDPTLGSRQRPDTNLPLGTQLARLARGQTPGTAGGGAHYAACTAGARRPWGISSARDLRASPCPFLKETRFSGPRRRF